ncbi:MAG TPA: neutral zinc metallopeptidase [Solirubrobacterales bacterium]|nr:neutral zinc metallopeptidase [Solirubrobacterales bacterium]
MRGLLATLLVSVVALTALSGCGTANSSNEPELPALPPIQHDLGPVAYRELIGDTFELLNEYWNEQANRLGETMPPPRALVSFWTRAQDKGCGGEKLGWQNAQYCWQNRTIAWDGNWVYGVPYRHLGDAAVAFLLGHEYGHMVQDELGVSSEFRHTIEAELNADCLSGAWLGAVNDQVITFDRSDYESLYDGMLEVADAYGVPWTDPSAHGTAAQRGRALLFGARHGARACINQLGPGFTA